jgi:tryptophan halogenase
MHGQGLRPRAAHPLAGLLDDRKLDDFLANIERVVGKCVDVMPSHKDFIAAIAKAGK